MLKVRDHCHFAGKYRGAAHNSCNLLCRKPMILPVIFHNLQGYDSHLIIKQLSNINGELTCIPPTEEKYISFSKKIKFDEYKSRRTGETVAINFEIRFIDSFKFLQTSLANFVSNLQPADFKNTKLIIKSNVTLPTQKGVYPYHDLYLKSDVLLLAHVFKNFRKTCLNITILIQHIITHLLDLLGTRV